MKSARTETNLIIKLREKRIYELEKQLSKIVARLFELEFQDREDSEIYKGLFLKAKECSCLIKLHRKSI